MKISELTGTKLDYWVAKADPMCEGCGIALVEGESAEGPHYAGMTPDGVAFFIPTKGAAQVFRLKRQYDGATAYRPHMDWSQGGLIIERERIGLSGPGPMGPVFGDMNRAWVARIDTGSFPGIESIGPTPLIAAMRAYVASKFGNEVPDDE